MIKSPCKKVCKIVTRISNDERFCLGCGRTPYEIKKWKTASDEYDRHTPGLPAAGFHPECGAAAKGDGRL